MKPSIKDTLLYSLREVILTHRKELSTANKNLSLANISLEENFRQTIISFAHALEESNPYTHGHSERVSVYARIIAVGMNMPKPQIETIVKVGLLHDVGKIGISNDYINKPGKLTPEELAMFRLHPAKGKRILEPIPFMRDIVPGCYCHHEAWDGSGYPKVYAQMESLSSVASLL